MSSPLQQTNGVYILNCHFNLSREHIKNWNTTRAMWWVEQKWSPFVNGEWSVKCFILVLNLNVSMRTVDNPTMGGMLLMSNFDWKVTWKCEMKEDGKKNVNQKSIYIYIFISLVCRLMKLGRGNGLFVYIFRSFVPFAPFGCSFSWYFGPL